MNKAAEILKDRARHEANKSSGYFDAKIDDPDLLTYVDQDGNEVQFLSAHHEMPLTKGTERLHLGKAIVGLVTGKWADDAELERLAMGGNVNTVGGVLVNDELSSMVLDLARAKAVCIQAGAYTVPMQSDRLVIARQITDPTIQVKGENALFNEASITFDGVGFTAHTIGALITLSRELAADAPNAADVIQNALAGALAVSLDTYMLVGTGSAQPSGLTVYSGVGSTGSIGAIAWEDVHAGVVAIQVANGEPNAYIASPTIAGDLALIRSDTGVGSGGAWLGPPPTVAPLRNFSTTSCPDTTIFVGDFTQAVFGLRQEGQIELTTEGGEAFQRHQLKIKITWRGDVGFLRPAHFHLLTGITT